MQIKKVPIASIVVNRESRQRRTLEDIEELAISIDTIGLLQPIIVDKNLTLVAGERRLAAMIHLGRDTIDVNFREDLTPESAYTIELEENAKRKNLTWIEQAKAIYSLNYIHDSVEKTAKLLSFSPSYISQNIRLAKALIQYPQLATKPTLKSALNLQVTLEEKSMEDDIENMIDEELNLPREELKSVSSSLLQKDFISWARDYKGERFNFVHCDFPPKRYAEYLEAFMYLENFLSNSAHIMIWLPMKEYSYTIMYMESVTEDIKWNPSPLIWQTDNNGNYKTALIGTHGKRKQNLPIHKHIRFNPSGKVIPYKVLYHFFHNFITPDTNFLDITHESSTVALTIAQEYKAKKLLGIEGE